MKISVLVNNYNYQKYVSQAIESALEQTYKPHEIIVVDDCSTDQSREILQQSFGENEKIKLILKDQNGGQLSSFNIGFQHSTGDIIFFLDADDLYEKDYLEKAVEFYKNNPQCDFLFCGAQVFGDEDRIAHVYNENRDLGFSKIVTLYRQAWIGHRTSTVSMRRSVLEKMMPIPFEEDWRIRADDCLVFGASIVNARKYYLADIPVKYRAHGNNGHYGRSRNYSSEYFVKREKAIEKLFSFLSERMEYPQNLYELAHLEFLSVPDPYKDELKQVRNLIKNMKISFKKKIKMMMLVHLHYYRKVMTKGFSTQ